MADPAFAVDGGQPSADPAAAGQPAPGPTETTGQPAQPQPASTAPATGQATQTDSGETFFDPSTLTEDLLPAYKQMQASYTKKTQALAKDRHAVEAYNAFMANPQASLQQLASQYGYSLSQAGQNPQAQQGQQTEGFDPNWQPQSWQEVFQKVEQQLKPKLRAEWEQEMQPVIDEVRRVKKTHIETVLDEATGGEWRQYEDDMTDMLRQHPTLANNPAMLARLAIPQEVQQQRAYKQALNKLQDKAEAAQVGGGSTTSQQQVEQPSGPMTLDQAVEFAKKQLAQRGLKAPG